MTKRKTEADGKVDVRLLVDCEHGRANTAVALDPAVAQSAVTAGVADDAEEAVNAAPAQAAVAAEEAPLE